MILQQHSDSTPGNGSGAIVSADGTPVLSLDNVSAGYGSTTVLRNVSLRVQPGEIVALLGPNGAGKTTTLRAAAGVVQVGQGSVSIGGSVITRTPPYRRAELGICLIPEGRGVFRSLTVRENLCLQVGRGARSPMELFDKALSIFPALRGRLNQLAGRLSGGQQQMLALARAYTTDPTVVLLDEVSMGLAPRVVEEIFQALHALAEAGVAMVLVEQYVTQAMAMADKVVLLNKGSVSYDGPPADLDEESVLQGYLGLGAEFE